MKKVCLMLAVLCGAMFFAGCGNSADENKTPAQIQSEVSKMNTADIQAMVSKYQKAIEEKSAQLKAETEKLAKIPLAEQLGKEAKAVKENIGKLSESLQKLNANMQAYADGLKKQAK